ncbi:helix-turn-helix transcriptional regulator [Paenibacillus allorhizosphaerae]|uniref:helix-turn-helix transcriptional regulator n=1 Tax=Paenibacillus allorhizosphaerae TaxID=2849866 RepID=UPI001E4B021F|nr:helix-turn-helix transcriptional regulator [Paenibacillus allorhizosphaerae]
MKARRTQLEPIKAGITGSYGRRRTSGLRREEVAELAGVSTTWYTWLEQGREVTASKEVIESIGRALQLSSDERIHLLRLAGYGELAPSLKYADEITPGLKSIIEQLMYPAIIANSRTEVLAWNKLATQCIMDFDHLSEQGQTMTWSIFMDPFLRKQLVNWEEFAEYSAAVFRAYYDQRTEDPWYEEFAGRLCQESQQFAAYWQRHEVQLKKTKPFILDHPQAGLLSFSLNSFAHINGNEEIHCCVYTPIAETDTEQKIKDYFIKN